MKETSSGILEWLLKFARRGYCNDWQPPAASPMASIEISKPPVPDLVYDTCARRRLLKKTHGLSDSEEEEPNEETSSGRTSSSYSASYSAKSTGPALPGDMGVRV